MITKRTASWCGPCGSYGWSLFNDVLSDVGDDALVVAAHYAGSLYENDASVAVVANFGGFGQPIFFLNNENLGVNSGNISDVRAEVQQRVAEMNAVPPVVQAGISATLNGNDSLLVKVKTHFFQETDKTVNLAVYIVERSFIGTQSGQGNMAQHKNVIRMAVNGDTFGEVIASGPTAQGTETAHEFYIPFSTLEAAGIDLFGLGDGRLIAAAVLWEDTGSGYEVLNTNQDREGVLASTAEWQVFNTFRLTPIINSASSSLDLNLPASVEMMEVSVFNINGQRVRPVFRGPLQAGRHSFEVDAQGLPSGLYLVRLAHSNEVGTCRMIVP